MTRLEDMNAQANAYTLGWQACFNGEDGRFTNPYSSSAAYGESEQAYAWTHGFLDAMEAEDGEQPEPSTAGY